MRDTRSDVATMAEKDLLSAIKRLAVKNESTLVHSIKLSKMTQAPGTDIRTFLARLRGQASLCQYVPVCASSLNAPTSCTITATRLLKTIWLDESLTLRYCQTYFGTLTDRNLEETFRACSHGSTTIGPQQGRGIPATSLQPHQLVFPVAQFTTGSKLRGDSTFCRPVMLILSPTWCHA